MSERIAEVVLQPCPLERHPPAAPLIQGGAVGGDSTDQRRVVAEVSPLVGPAEARQLPIGTALVAILRRQQFRRLFIQLGCLAKAQAGGLHLGLLTHQAGLLAMLIGRHFVYGLTFGPHQVARLLELRPRKVMIGRALQRRSRRLAPKPALPGR